LGDSSFRRLKALAGRKKMMEIQVIAIPTEIAEQVWETMKSPGYGHPASTSLAKGHGPCRHCLKPFRIGEELRTLFTYNPFTEAGMIPLPGPVFIHAERCERFAREKGYPVELLPYAAVLDGYDGEERVVTQRRVTDLRHEAAIVEMLGDQTLQYVIVRDLKAGCFDLRAGRKGDV
jgi:hypothetical protein